MLFIAMGLVPVLAWVATVDITIDDNGFQPSGVTTIHKGDTVRWTNTGTVVHDVASGFFRFGTIAPAAVFEQTFIFHGTFGIYDTDNAAATQIVDVDSLVFISPESSTFYVGQGFDLAFFFNLGGTGNPWTQWEPSLTQCSISFDGVNVGNCEDVFANPSFRSVPTQGFGNNFAYILTIPPGTLPPGFHSLSIEGAVSDGRTFSDTAWYTVLGPGGNTLP